LQGQFVNPAPGAGWGGGREGHVGSIGSSQGQQHVDSNNGLINDNYDGPVGTSTPLRFGDAATVSGEIPSIFAPGINTSKFEIMINFSRDLLFNATRRRWVEKRSETVHRFLSDRRKTRRLGGKRVEIVHRPSGTNVSRPSHRAQSLTGTLLNSASKPYAYAYADESLLFAAALAHRSPHKQHVETVYTSSVRRWDRRARDGGGGLQRTRM
jgi:hypothetical protein